MKGVFLTAGAAGMFCGSCMHDNALARALRDDGVDCLLQPVYTPIRTDDSSVAASRVFFGGVHIYLLQQMPWMRHVPLSVRRLLDWPPLIRFATRKTRATDAAALGSLAVSMLRGAHGRQAEEVKTLVDWLADEVRPDAVVLSNLLIGGALPEIRRRLPNTKLAVILQGDDIFLDHLSEEHRSECVTLCRGLIPSLDHVIVNSQFYANKMGELFDIPAEKLHVTPLSIDTRPFVGGNAKPSAEPPDQEFRLGYLARLSPEKGFHRLVEAFVRLADQPGNENLTLHAAGWLGETQQAYFDSQLEILRAAGLNERFTYHGSPDLEGKADYLRSLDLLSVPTEYHEPKGLFVLESLASGVPVVQPEHGAFGELVRSTGGGLLVAPDDTDALVNAIQGLKDDPTRRLALGSAGRDSVTSRHTIEVAAKEFRQLLFAETGEP